MRWAADLGRWTYGLMAIAILGSVSSADARPQEAAATETQPTEAQPTEAQPTEAQPTEAERGAARELVYAGDRLAERGDYEGALGRYAAADRIMNVPTTGVEVARMYERLGRLLEAKDKAEQVAAYPRRAGEPPPFTKARDQAEELVKSLESRLPRLTIAVAGAAARDDVTIRVDGVVRAEPDGPIDPGRHQIEVEAIGYAPARRQVDLAEGQQERVELTLEPLTSAGPDVFDVMMIGGFGIAGAGLVVGAVTGGLSLSATSALKERCSEGLCPPEEEDELDRANTLATVSDVSFVVAGVGAVLGLVGLIVPLAASEDEVAWTLRPDGLVLRF